MKPSTPEERAAATKSGNLPRYIAWLIYVATDLHTSAPEGMYIDQQVIFLFAADDNHAHKKAFDISTAINQHKKDVRVFLTAVRIAPYKTDKQ